MACGSRVLDTCTRTNCTHKIRPHKQVKGAKRMHKGWWIEKYCPFCTRGLCTYCEYFKYFVQAVNEMANCVMCIYRARCPINYATSEVIKYFFILCRKFQINEGLGWRWVAFKPCFGIFFY